MSTNTSGITATSVGGINNAGTIVGYAKSYVANVDKGTRAVRWDATGTTPTELVNLGTNAVGFTNSAAILINDSNTIVGTARKYAPMTFADLGMRPVRWNAGGAITELGVLSTNSSGVGSATPYAMNSTGTAVGVSNKYLTDSDIYSHAVRWLANTSVAVELQSLQASTSGAVTSRANAINALGVAAGLSDKYSGTTHLGQRPVRWNAGTTTPTELPILGTDINGTTFTNVYDIDNSGGIVGYVAKYSSNPTHDSLGVRAVRWNANNTVTELGVFGTTPAGSTVTYAYGTNELGVVVGNATTYNASGVETGTPATFWSAADVPTSLETLLPANSGWATLNVASEVSDTGFITGYGNYDPDGPGGVPLYTRMFMMLVPQAGTYGKGDANFDTAVSFADLVILAQRYNQSNPGGSANVADINLDCAVNFQDLVVLAQNYGYGESLTGGASEGSFAVDWALAQSLVPEPALALSLGAAAAVRRRRSRC